MSSTIARYSRLACALYSCVFGFSDRYLYRRLLLCCRSFLACSSVYQDLLVYEESRPVVFIYQRFPKRGRDRI